MVNTSPFPGMDPYLEESGEWSNIHTRLINAISDRLADAVTPHFSVKIETRVYIVVEDTNARRFIEPDLYLIQTRPQAATVDTTLQFSPYVLVQPLYNHEVREHFIEIRDKHSHEVITTIELLSPFNKASGSPGLEAFRSKRQAVMHSTTNWLEIDLLRAGERPPEVAGKSHYYVLLKRASMFGPFEVWYFDLRDTLPRVLVPLRNPLPEVVLDLQAAFDDMYRRARLADSVNYQQAPPPPPLRSADFNWAQQQINLWMEARQANVG